METRHIELSYQPARFEQLSAEIRAVQRELAEIVEVAESEDGWISAKVDARGDLLELTLDPRIYRDPDSKALSRAIEQTYRAARAAADERAFTLTMRLRELPSVTPGN
ncbi:YbaB/EbfC family nucleoid-associated protein [Amycolatopsis antarctica]|nr:YbaB/EbfC family nucleoid-associated protein [Amycolatopsis antarctica]